MTEENDLSFEIRKLFLLIRRCDNYIPKNTPTKLQAEVLGFIYLNKQQGKNTYQKDIEKRFSIRPATVTRLLKGMEKADLISRIAEEHDGRLKRIVFTSHAEELKLRIDKHTSDLNEILIRGLSKDEISTLTNLIKKIQNNILEAKNA